MKKDIGIEDLYAVLDTHKSDKLGDQMSHAWESEVRLKKNTNKEPSLIRALIQVFGWRIALLGFFVAAIEFLLR